MEHQEKRYHYVRFVKDFRVMRSPKKKFEPQTIGEVLDDIVGSKALKTGLTNAKVVQIWSKLMGENIERYTDKIIVRNKTLTISLSSAPLREELTYGKEKIIRMINEETGVKLIEKNYISLKMSLCEKNEIEFQ